jgi:hypothetical protein
MAKKKPQAKYYEGEIKDGREYCQSCHEDITIIRSHDCTNGFAFGSVLPINIRDYIRK